MSCVVCTLTDSLYRAGQGKEETGGELTQTDCYMSVLLTRPVSPRCVSYPLPPATLTGIILLNTGAMSNDAPPQQLEHEPLYWKLIPLTVNCSEREY